MSGERKEITECLIEIAQELGGTLTAEEALHVIIEHMKVFFPHQSLAMLILDENTGTLNIKTSREISYSFVKHFKRSIGGTGGAGYPCLSSEGLFESTVKYARTVFDIYPEKPTIGIMPQDAYVSLCQCELCKGKDTPERGWNGILSDYV